MFQTAAVVGPAAGGVLIGEFGVPWAYACNAASFFFVKFKVPETNGMSLEHAETLFVPVAIYNNEGGADREVLARFKEPA